MPYYNLKCRECLAVTIENVSYEDVLNIKIECESCHKQTLERIFDFNFNILQDVDGSVEKRIVDTIDEAKDQIKREKDNKIMYEDII